jgi:hypothetical protein
MPLIHMTFVGVRISEVGLRNHQYGGSDDRSLRVLLKFRRLHRVVDSCQLCVKKNHTLSEDMATACIRAHWKVLRVGPGVVHLAHGSRKPCIVWSRRT